MRTVSSSVYSLKAINNGRKQPNSRIIARKMFFTSINHLQKYCPAYPWVYNIIIMKNNPYWPGNDILTIIHAITLRRISLVQLLSLTRTTQQFKLIAFFILMTWMVLYAYVSNVWILRETWEYKLDENWIVAKGGWTRAKSWKCFGQFIHR